MIALLLLYPIYATVMYANQTAILFPAASDKHHPLAARLPDDGRLVEIPASFGKVRAVYLRAPKTQDRGAAIIYLHGNFECIEDSFAVLQPLVAAHIPLLQVEFPGFCGADGKPTFSAINEASDLSYDWLAKQPEVDPSKILVMGYSIGGGAAAELTAHRAARALILLSTYTSMQDMAHRYALPNFLVRYPYDTLARVREFKGPVFIEHGRVDKVIPFAMGAALAASNVSSEFVALDCGHDTCRFDRTVFSERLPAWLATHHIIERSAQVSTSGQ
jgi:pimeloyl-ACP methyl ester carboxylesterase